MVGCGATICYADPKTLTQTGAFPIGALEQFSPTIMAGVPKIWDVIKKGVQGKILLAPPLAQFFFNLGFKIRSTALSNGFDAPFFRTLVFKKFAAVVGGRLRLAMSGGGPLNTEVQIFVRTCFGCPLFQGYGLTETCAGLTIQTSEDLRCGIAGVPLACCEVKLESCPDIQDKKKKSYLIEDRVDHEGNAILGRGEVLVKGGNVTKGYYMLPEKTAEEFEPGTGWFHTGDIGQFMADGSIRIVDRKKNLLKLKGGEYIAIENMEMCYGNSNFVDAVNGGICCYGDGDMDRPVALMQLNEPIAKAWAKANGFKNESLKELAKNATLMKVILADLHSEGKKAGLSNLEKLIAVVFLTEPWTPENGCLTAANKLQRRTVIELFSKEFEILRVKGIFK
jgi:long-chain acyl-CoA synthetase